MLLTVSRTEFTIHGFKSSALLEFIRVSATALVLQEQCPTLRDEYMHCVALLVDSVREKVGCMWLCSCIYALLLLFNRCKRE